MKTKLWIISVVLAGLWGLGLNNSVNAQLLFEENFDYPAGDYLTAHGWTAHSGGGTAPVSVLSPGLTMDDYSGSGIGNLAAIVATGEDVNHTFAQQTSGTMYVSFLMRMDANTTAGCFLHMGQTVIGTTFFARVWANAGGTGIGLGIGTAAPTTYVTITPTSTYLVVMKLDLATKEYNLLVSDTFPTAEPAIWSQTITETTTYSNVGCIALRQFNASQRQYVDAIRVGMSWYDVVTSAPVATFNPANGATNVPINSNITITFDEKVRNLDNSAITTPSSLIVLKETDASGADVPFTATLDVTNKIFTIDPVSDLANYQQYYVAISPVEDSIDYATTLLESTFTTVSNDVTPPVVLSATATSLTNILVVFDEPVDATAENIANYTGVGTITSATRTATLDSVNVVLTTPLTFGVKDTICVENIADIVGNAMTASSCHEVQFGVLDVTPPVVDTAWAESTTIVKVKFNEVVDNTTAETITNYTGLPGISTAVLSTSMDTVTLTLSSPLTFGMPDTVCVANVEDTAGNAMAASQCLEVVYGVLDVTPPTVLNAWPEDLATVKVVYSEAVDNVTAETITNYTGLAGIGTATLNTALDTVTLALSTHLISGVADTLYVQNVEDTAGNAMAAQQMFVLFLDTSTTVANLVITEIMYNPAESGTDSTEFIEFLNNGSASVNLLNYVIAYGASTHTITTPVIVNPGERFLVAPNATAATNFYGMPFYQGSTSGISNSGTFITIKNSSGIIVDSVMYDDVAPWPTAADEGGYSLSLCDPSLDNNNGANWGLGTVFFATVNTHDVYADPGQGCVVPVDVTPPVVDTAIAVDLNTIKVIFNEAVDNVTAEDIINYTGLAGVSTATLNSAMDTVTLALSTPLIDNIADTVCIANVEDTAGNVMAASQCFRVIFSIADIIPPTVVNAWPVDLATVKVAYSEAVDNVTAETIANYTGLAGIGTATLNTALDTVTLALSTHLISGVADTLYIQNVEDTAGNAMAAQQMFVLMLDTSTTAKHLVITEIMYNPAESGTDSTEFIEIYNNDVVAVDLMGYVLQYSTNTFTFPSMIMNPGDYVLVSTNAAAASNFYGETFIQGNTVGISNSGTYIVIHSPTGLLVDTVMYDDAAPWSTLADGGGYSLSLCDPNLDNNVATNWELGHIYYGTVNTYAVYADPGQGCAVANDSIPPVATHAWLTNFTTVKVRFNEDVDLTSAETEANYTGLGTISNAILNTNADTVTLTLATPMVSGVTDTLYVTNIADTAGNVMSIVYAFPLMLDTTSTVSALVISEIMYNPPEAGIDSLEFVEIYNNDAVAVDLLNYKITWGTSYKVFDASYVINPGEYAIIAPNKAAADAFYGIVSIQGPTGGISNSGTSVKLNSPSGLLVDSLTYGNAAPWPTEANGLGASLTLCDVNTDNTDAANWSASTRFVGIINVINVYADPDTTCVGDGIAEDVFNSINVYPNPANDFITIAGIASAKRIEIYNNMGMLVLSRNTEGDETIIIEAAELSNGLYYINIRMNDGAVETKPVVIIK